MIRLIDNPWNGGDYSLVLQGQFMMPKTGSKTWRESRRGSTSSISSFDRAGSAQSKMSNSSRGDGSQTSRSTTPTNVDEATLAYVHRRKQSYTETMQEKSLGARFLKVVPPSPLSIPLDYLSSLSSPPSSSLRAPSIPRRPPSGITLRGTPPPPEWGSKLSDKSPTPPPHGRVVQIPKSHPTVLLLTSSCPPYPLCNLLESVIGD
jgi:hypothetical protein